MLQPDMKPMLRETGLKPLEIPLGNLPSGSAEGPGQMSSHSLLIHPQRFQGAVPSSLLANFLGNVDLEEDSSRCGMERIVGPFFQPGHVTDHYDCQRFLSNWYTKS